MPSTVEEPEPVSPGFDTLVRVGRHVFISYSSPDRSTAELICAGVEAEHAVSDDISVLLLRVEDVLPSKGLKYFVSAHHWLDAWMPPLETHIGRLSDALRSLGPEVDESSVERSGALRICAASRSALPQHVGAIVVEEDTFFVLSAESHLPETPEHPIRVMTAAMEAEAQPLGSVSIRGGAPLVMAAVVHDLDQVPTCREQWVAAALAEVFREVEHRGLTSIALPLLGTVHGALEPRRALAVLAEALDDAPAVLERVVLIGSTEAASSLIELLRHRAKCLGGGQRAT